MTNNITTYRIGNSLKSFLAFGTGIILTSLLLISCSKEVIVSRQIDKLPEVYPDYTNVTLPANICPIHFTTKTPSKDLNAVFESGDVRVEVASSGDQIAISEGDWAKLCEASGKIRVTVQLLQGEEWVGYRPFTLTISKDSIDPYMAYRLIEPGYEIWREMGIYQRCLENFEEDEIITNRMTDHNCMNCHTFCSQNPDKMLFHMRKDYGGTYIIDDGKIEVLDTKTPENISAFVYPSWHPSGDFVAFSTNTTKQMFHTSDLNRIEVFDYQSDVIVYDVKNHETISTPLLKRKEKFETFPSFSPDGKTLYFCCADSVTMHEEIEKAHYSLCSISFDPATKTFGEEVDTLINIHEDSLFKDKSIAFPRLSPDGKQLLFTVADYGNFHIWHKEAKIYLYDISKQTTQVLPTEGGCAGLSWSSNSRWAVFGNRSDDGLYTRPYIVHVDEKGKPSKPFLLPQADAHHYDRTLKSFNLPEMIRGKVSTSQMSIARKAHAMELQKVK